MPQHRPALHQSTLIFSRSTHPLARDARLERPRRVGRRTMSLTLAFTLGVTLALSLALVDTRALAHTSSAGASGASVPQTPPGLWLSSTGARAVLRLSLRSSRRRHGDPRVRARRRRRGDPLARRPRFDDAGRMWVANQGDSVLLAFSPRQPRLGQRARPGDRALGDQPLAERARRSRLRPASSLWAANFGNGTLVRFDPAQLSSSGAPVPSRSSADCTVRRPSPSTAAGTLWVADIASGPSPRTAPISSSVRARRCRAS